MGKTNRWMILVLVTFGFFATLVVLEKAWKRKPFVEQCALTKGTIEVVDGEMEYPVIFWIRGAGFLHSGAWQQVYTTPSIYFSPCAGQHWVTYESSVLLGVSHDTIRFLTPEEVQALERGEFQCY